MVILSTSGMWVIDSAIQNEAVGKGSKVGVSRMAKRDPLGCFRTGRSMGDRFLSGVVSGYTVVVRRVVEESPKKNLPMTLWLEIYHGS